MVIRGRCRGNGRQLASYLLKMQDNEAIRLLDVDGQECPSEQSLRNLLGDFSALEQLTRSRQGLYHAMINPETDYSREMTDKEWQKAADILAKELGFAERRRAIVLHTKFGRAHAHVVFERYDHDKRKMIPISHNYRKHDKARAIMEQVFSHQPTPKRNPHRREAKAILTKLWKEQQGAGTFLQAARKAGYFIATGYERKPYMAVDDTGQSFNLVRHLEGVNLPEVRQRFKDVILPTEREAIGFIRTQEDVTGHRSQKARKRIRPDEQNEQRTKTKNAFASNHSDTVKQKEEFLKQLKQVRQQITQQKPRMR